MRFRRAPVAATAYSKRYETTRLFEHRIGDGRRALPDGGANLGPAYRKNKTNPGHLHPGRARSVRKTRTKRGGAFANIPGGSLERTAAAVADRLSRSSRRLPVLRGDYSSGMRWKQRYARVYETTVGYRYA